MKVEDTSLLLRRTPGAVRQFPEFFHSRVGQVFWKSAEIQKIQENVCNSEKRPRRITEETRGGTETGAGEVQRNLHRTLESEIGGEWRLDIGLGSVD